MDRDDFIIAVYLLVCEHYQAIRSQYRLRRGGSAPALTDEEVITIEICGECFKPDCDKDLFAYFHTHYAHFFPKLRDRSLFVRQAANLWQVKAAIQKRLVTVSGQVNDPVQVIDTLPLLVCVLTRARRDRCFDFEADFGYCAAKDMHYYGSKAYRQALLLERHCIAVVTPVRKNMQTDLPTALLRFCRRIRKFVETVGTHLTERFGVDQIRVHDLWHFQHRLIRKILAHTVCVFLNLRLGRPPLDLDDLVAA